MSELNPYWIAPREGQDWTDPVVSPAVDWLGSFVDPDSLQKRISHQEKKYHEAIVARQNGEMEVCFDEKDKISWFLLQSQSYASDRKVFDYNQICQIVPYFRQIGLNLELIKKIPGIKTRATRMMGSEKSQPESGIFEILVAAAYARNGWKVQFVDETPGISKQPDLHVRKPGTRWAVECKRLKNSTYQIMEKIEAQRISHNFHQWCRRSNRSLIAEVIFQNELSDIHSDFLIEAFNLGEDVSHLQGRYFSGENAHVRFRPVKWDLLKYVMDVDDVFYGSSRMIELLTGQHQLRAEYSMSAIWKPSCLRPAYAEKINQASVVTWWSESINAKKRRAKHFKQTLSKAEQQLPGDRPGVVHIGCPGQFDNDVEGQRHFYNWLYLCDFMKTNSRLRWVNAHLLKPEYTTNFDETWAFQETTIPYRVGRHNTKNPLLHEMLVVPKEEGVII